MSDPSGSAAIPEQIAYWNSRAGERWAALQASLDAVFAPLTDAAMAFARVPEGGRVIDVGCGCGATVLELAQRVGPRGHVLGVDVSKPMLDVARQRAAGLSQVELVLADASTRAFSPDADLIFSRFGVMFFEDPVAAFTNLRHALAPGGRLAMMAWRGLAENDWFHVPLDAVGPLLPPQEPSDPDGPGPFGLANRERTERILSQAGFSDIEMQPHEAPLPIGGSPAEAADFLVQIGPVARALADAPDGMRDAATQALSAALRSRHGAADIVLGGAVWLISARG